jgi:hypothetical protein
VKKGIGAPHIIPIREVGANVKRVAKAKVPKTE